MDNNPETATFNPASKVEGLSGKQVGEIAAQSRPNAALIHETIRAEGESELDRHWLSILLSGSAAGLSIGLSLFVQGQFDSLISDASIRRLVGSLGYTIGFVVVVLGRQQLFTENTLSPILPLLHHRDRKTLINVGRLWALVLVANIAGTWAFSLALTHLDGVEPRTWDAFVEIGRRTVDKSFSSTFFHAVVAGWLIALMMWLLPAVKSSRLHIIVVMTYIIALGEFSHIVAGSVDCAFLVLIGKASLGEYFAVFFAPTLLGNVVGGTLLVALLNYGQVATEISPSSDR